MKLRDWLNEMKRPDGLPGESDGEYTDRCRRLGYERGINRQCSIGWHDECSDPNGDECQCVCHEPSPAYGELAHWLAYEMDEGDELRKIITSLIEAIDVIDDGIMLNTIPVDQAQRIMDDIAKARKIMSNNGSS